MGPKHQRVQAEVLWKMLSFWDEVHLLNQVYWLFHNVYLLGHAVIAVFGLSEAEGRRDKNLLLSESLSHSAVGKAVTVRPAFGNPPILYQICCTGNEIFAVCDLAASGYVPSNFGHKMGLGVGTGS
jgi:hypothetical protein